jgi:FkbM family methyltransferase
MMTASTTIPKRVLRSAYSLLIHAYVFIFGRPTMQRVNRVLLDLALHGKGYKNPGGDSGEGKFLELLSHHRPQLCVDVGANKGNYSKALLEVTGSKVIAFEPLPGAFAALREIGRNFPDRFTAINKGVADRNSVLDLHFSEEDSEWASFSTEINEIPYIAGSNKNSVRVEVLTLDDFFENHPAQIDLLKIDTEGYEYEVLVGARETIRSNGPKFIQIEFNWHQLFRGRSLYALASLLPDYVAYQLLPTGLQRVDVRQPENNIYHYSNFVFVRNDIAI